MLDQFGPGTILAILIGGVLAVLAFLPVVALRYRKAGRLRFFDLVMLLICAVYAMSLWTYTLIPLPESAQYRCAGANFQPFAFVGDVVEGMAKTGNSFRGLLQNWALMQTVFNVALFAPLGFLLRLVFRRGVVVGTIVGSLVSLIIESTQYTAIWGMYPCAYRTFDVDDLMTNTLGALLGSLFAWPIARLMQSRPIRPVTSVTAGRRVVGVFADLFLINMVGLVTLIAWSVFQFQFFGVSPEKVDPLLENILMVVPAFILEAAWVLRDGRTCGEAIVDLRPIGGNLRHRLVKFSSGVGIYLTLSLIQLVSPSGVMSDITGWLMSAFCLTSLVLIFTTKDHRGLSGLISGLPMGIDPPRLPPAE